MKGNEKVDILAKQSLKLQTIDLYISLSESITKYLSVAGILVY